MRDGRLAKTDADLVKTLEIRIRQIGIPLTDIVDRFIQPVALIFLCGLEDTAAVDVTEQLVTRSVEEFFFGQTALQIRVAGARLQRAGSYSWLQPYNVTVNRL